MCNGRPIVTLEQRRLSMRRASLDARRMGRRTATWRARNERRGMQPHYDMGVVQREHHREAPGCRNTLLRHLVKRMTMRMDTHMPARMVMRQYTRIPMVNRMRLEQGRVSPMDTPLQRNVMTRRGRRMPRRGSERIGKPVINDIAIHVVSGIGNDCEPVVVVLSACGVAPHILKPNVIRNATLMCRSKEEWCCHAHRQVYRHADGDV